MNRMRPPTAVMASVFSACAAIAEANDQPFRKITMEELFAADKILEVRITVAPGDWDKIRRQSRDFMTALHESRIAKPSSRPFNYVDADVVINGVRFPKVGVRKKGFIGSLDARRPSLKIKLNHTDKNGRIDGITNLTLNNNKQDSSQISQYLSYQLFRAAGVPASRCSFARVKVNGNDLGIYSHVESVRKPMLLRAFGDDGGTLYEGTVADFFEGWENSFEHKTGDDQRGREKIRQVTQILNGDGNGIAKAIGEHVDLDAFFTYWAMEGLLGFWDGYSSNQNNYFFYLKPGTGRFHFMPWGTDALFMRRSMINFDFRTPLSVKTKGLVANRLYQIPEMRERYRKTLLRLLKSVWDDETLLAEIDRVEKMIGPHLSRRQRGFSRALNRTRNFIKNRREELMEELEDGPVEYTKKSAAPPVIGKIGQFKGSFSGRWFEDSPRERITQGKADMTLTMEGNEVEFRALGMHASFASGFGQGEKPAVRFVGERADNGKKVSIDLMIEEEDFQVTGDVGIKAGGMFREGSFFSFGFRNMRFVGGNLKLSEVAQEEGSRVAGEFNGTVMKLIGGF